MVFRLFSMASILQRINSRRLLLAKELLTADFGFTHSTRESLVQSCQAIQPSLLCLTNLSSSTLFSTVTLCSYNSWFFISSLFLFSCCYYNVCGEQFVLPGEMKTTKGMIGLWYKNDSSVQSVVWVANRNGSLTDPFSSTLKLIEDGELVLVYNSSTKVWCTNSSLESNNSTEAVLIDTNGDLVIRNWLDSFAVNWFSFNETSQSWVFDLNNKFDELDALVVIMDYTFWLKLGKSSSFECRSPYLKNVRGWGGVEIHNFEYQFSRLDIDNDNSFFYNLHDKTSSFDLVIEIIGWTKQEGVEPWSEFWPQPRSICDCGAFSMCDHISYPRCACLQGFEPKFLTDWNLRNFSGGCVRRHPLQCSAGLDTFVVIPNIQLLGSYDTILVEDISECESACLNNCSCIAYSFDGFEGDRHCLMWFGNLLKSYKSPLDRYFQERNIQIRLAASDRKTYRRLITFLVIAMVICLILIGFVFIEKYRRREFIHVPEAAGNLVLFKHKVLRTATNNFSEELGRGGFGTVYKGRLPNSTAVAVKELRYYTPDEKQFRAEVNTIGLIQHVNLIRLRGFCAEGKKRLLVYDYLPNGSLGSLLFGMDSNILDWNTRYQIALGIARGLAYLHEKCRDCILHLDIKPDNILLDAEFNPKVGDFGLAKVLGRNFSRVLTTMRGTRGYLAPEWLSGVPITAKVDVYSYGMMLFEIVSGKRNLNVVDDDMMDYFPARAASKMDKAEEILSLLDHRLEGNADAEELARACKVACWCIQDDEKDRPSMGYVVHVLEGVLNVDTPPLPRFLQMILSNSMEKRTSLALLDLANCCTSTEASMQAS